MTNIFFINDYLRFVWVFPLQTKDRTIYVFLSFKNMIEKNFGVCIKSVQTDGGEEFKPLVTLLEKDGVEHRLTCPHTSQQNGGVEAWHRRIVERGLTLMFSSKVPLIYWPLAFKTVVFLLNRTPSKVLNNKSPYFLLYHKEPSFDDLKVYGCQYFPCLRDYNSNQLQTRSVECAFRGMRLNREAAFVLKWCLKSNM